MSGTVVLVTGASTGIGRAAARRFKAQGFRVLATARKTEDLVSLQAEGFVAIPLEMADPASVAACAAAALREGPPTVLVNNAGYGEMGPIEETSREAWLRQFETNVFGHMELTRLLLPAMREAGGGRILFTSSVVGRLSVPYLGAYSASKHALEAAADALRVEVRPWNIRVTLIEPGPVTTQFSGRVKGTFEPRNAPGSPYLRAHRRAAKVMELLDRGVKPETVARVIVRQATSAFPRRRRVVGPLPRLGMPFRAITPAWLIDWASAVILGLTRGNLNRKR
ncbi:MAG TPA: SDR family oxidoreductase [Candidatus Thermoplasmatota archaeon]|nr:SDR family oxidoreductase [Candidatus Thermoplasmatota archaeon]